MFDLVSVLHEDLVVEIFLLQTARDQLTNESRYHQARHERELVRHLKNDQDCCDRRLHDSAETSAHRADSEQSRIRSCEARENGRRNRQR